MYDLVDEESSSVFVTAESETTPSTEYFSDFSSSSEADLTVSGKIGGPLVEKEAPLADQRIKVMIPGLGTIRPAQQQ